MYSELQNTTCLLAPDTIFGPYDVNGELHRHDVREDEEGINLYLDLGLIDVETCEPLPNAWITIWACNATGTYSGYTGIDPNTVSVLPGWSTREDGTTDDETFLRGISKTNDAGIAEFLTVFPGYYDSRTTHIHVAVQSNVLAPYHAHLSTLNRTLNSEDSVYSVANADRYSAIISTELVGEILADGLIGYITIGVNKSASAIATVGTQVNVQGYIPTVSLTSGAQAAANTKDPPEGYRANGMRKL
ncbi:hypothetical protein N7448_002328 [Penicillium atrosanguineum]|nr:hypothetical protein N7448_002328 [Penicillium atrosanguineum]